MIIAIDGPAASGKGTIAKGLAKYYGLPHLDTGLLYRAIGQAMQDQLDDKDFEQKAIKIAHNLDKSQLDAKKLGTPEIANAAAKVAKIEQVREALRQYQSDFAQQKGGAVLDGRDIGTRICPNADVKLFIIADAKTRANRRYLELLSKGLQADEGEILRQIIMRDESDRNNPSGNFYEAQDSHLLDSSKLDIETSLRKAIAIVDNKMAK
ncbi:MAG: (d)CMP kinase [Devosiaceae bacterium]|nr:(d)CMP kinase [Devosiaceae bacterium]